MGDDAAAAIASFRIRTVKDGDGFAEVTEVRLCDKGKASEQRKHLGLDRDPGASDQPGD